LNNKI